VHIVELSTAVVEVDVKVISAILTQNQCLQWGTPPLTYVEISQLRNATELSMMAWSSSSTSTTKQNRIYPFFPQKRFNQRRLQFLFAYSFSNYWLAVSCFPFEKLLLNVCIWVHLHVMML